MISLIIGILVSLVVTIVGTPLLIRLVHKLNYGQYIRQDGPQSHLVKRGTPTLGGVVINLAIVLGWGASALYRFLHQNEMPSWSAVLVLFAMLFMRCYKIIMGQSDLRDRFSAFGVTLVLAIGATLNLAVVMGMAPPKGVAMPFLSYGGSSILTSFLAMGIVSGIKMRPAPDMSAHYIRPY